MDGLRSHDIVVQKDPPSICEKKRTLLLLDRFSAHVSKEFEEELLFHDNIDLILIPSGLTYLLQPLDVSVNKSFKVKVRNEWKLWLDKSRLKILGTKEESKTNTHNTGEANTMEIIDKKEEEELNRSKSVQNMMNQK